jgi:hypothetical protein
MFYTWLDPLCLHFIFSAVTSSQFSNNKNVSTNYVKITVNVFKINTVAVWKW